MTDYQAVTERLLSMLGMDERWAEHILDPDCQCVETQDGLWTCTGWHRIQYPNDYNSDGTRKQRELTESEKLLTSLYEPMLLAAFQPLPFARDLPPGKTVTFRIK